MYIRVQVLVFMIDFNTYINSLLDGYRSSYDVEINENNEDVLYATAHMHMEHVQGFIFKEFRMTAADADEYVYIYRIPELNEETCKEIIQRTYDDGFPKIKLDHVTFNHQHMCTRLVALFVCDNADEAALKAIRKCRIYKSFQFSLKGWMEVHTAVLNLEDGSVISNSYGRETAKFLKKHVDHYLKQHV